MEMDFSPHLWKEGPPRLSLSTFAVGLSRERASSWRGGNEAVALDKVWARAWNRRVNANAAIGSDAPNFALRVSSTELSKAGGWQRPNWVPDKTPAREEIGKHLKTAKGDKKRGGKRKGQLWTSSVGVIDKRVK